MYRLFVKVAASFDFDEGEPRCAVVLGDDIVAVIVARAAFNDGDLVGNGCRCRGRQIERLGERVLLRRAARFTKLERSHAKDGEAAIGRRSFGW